MSKSYIYPGSFCPPTYGHLAIVKEAASTFHKITILCSYNENKPDKWFSQEECKLDMLQLSVPCQPE